MRDRFVEYQWLAHTGVTNSADLHECCPLKLMSNSRAPEVEDFVTRTCADAEKIVRELLPAKMRELDILLTVSDACEITLSQA